MGNYNFDNGRGLSEVSTLNIEQEHWIAIRPFTEIVRNRFNENMRAPHCENRYFDLSSRNVDLLYSYPNQAKGKQRHRVFYDAEKPVENNSPSPYQGELWLASGLLAIGLMAAFSGLRLMRVEGPYWKSTLGKFVFCLGCIAVATAIEGFRQLN